MRVKKNRFGFFVTGIQNMLTVKQPDKAFTHYVNEKSGALDINCPEMSAIFSLLNLASGCIRQLRKVFRLLYCHISKHFAVYDNA